MERTQIKTIKVLHLIKTLNLGGAESNLFNLISATDQKKFEIYVGYSFGGENESKFQMDGVRLFKYAQHAYKVKSLGSLIIILRLILYILKHNIQIIHTHNFNTHIWGTIAGKLTRRQVLEHVHDYRYLELEDYRRRRGEINQFKFAKLMKNLPDRVVVLTKQNEEYLICHKICPQKRIREIQNGIPIDRNVPIENKNLRRNLGIEDGALIVLTPARIEPTKNIDLILRIASEVVHQVPNATFLICGAGPSSKEIVSKCKEMKLEKNVKLIGFYPGDIRELLKISDVFLLPSFLELHSIAILEALSFRLPIVVSRDVGCNNEFIDHWKNGVLCDPFLDEEWSQSIIKLLKNASLRQEIALNGYNTCLERFDIKDVSKKFERLYEEMLNV